MKQPEQTQLTIWKVNFCRNDIFLCLFSLLLKYYCIAIHNTLIDSDDEIDYNEIPIEEFEEFSDSDEEETLEKAVRNINEKNFFGGNLYEQNIDFN